MIRRILIGAGAGIATLACGDSGGPSGPAFLAEVFGDSQEVEVSTSSAPLQVQVVDTLGQPVAGVLVKFSITQRSGSVITRDTSDESGGAQTIFTADATLGHRKIRAYGVLADVVFDLFVVPAGTTVATPARITITTRGQ
jgi:hypothetical protein